MLGEFDLIPFEWNGSIATLEKEDDSLEGKIIECYHIGDNKWRVVRVREKDKNNPNKKTTAKAIMRLIESHLCKGTNMNRCQTHIPETHSYFVFDNERLCERLGLIQSNVEVQ